MNIVRYYITPKYKDRHKGFMAVYGNWPRRSIDYRGWGKPIAQRNMTKDEIEDERNFPRYHATYYPTIEKLLLDEQTILPKDQYDILYAAFIKCSKERGTVL